MKKILSLILIIGFSLAQAKPFIYPDSWFAESSTNAKHGGTLRTALRADFKTFNPFTTAESTNAYYFTGANARLFILNPVTDKFMPLMAAEMPEIRDNGKTFIVKIRTGMRFSDGRPITAKDWVTTYKIHSDKDVGSSQLRNLFMGKDILTVKQLDNYTLQFNFPYASIAAYQKMSLIPWPHHVFGPVYEQGGAEAIKKMWTLTTPPTELVSPGAWVLQNYIPGQRVILTKNRFFGKWNKNSKGRSLPYLNYLNIKILTNGEAILASYLAGDLDLYHPRHTTDLLQIKKAITEKNLKAKLLANLSPVAGSNWITFNWNRGKDLNKQKLFRNVRFRRAMSHLANRPAMIQLALGGSGTPVYTSVHPVFKNYQFKSTPKYPYNPKAATKLLNQIGYSDKNTQGYLVNNNGKALEFDLLVEAGNIVDERMARIFVDEAKELGINVNLKTLAFNNIVSLLTSEGPERNWDAVLLSISGGDKFYPYLAGSVICGAMFHPFNRLGEGKCLTANEQQIASLYKKGDQTLDDEKRRQIGEKISKLEAGQQAMIYLASSNFHVSHNNRMGGFYKKEIIDAINRESVPAFIGNYFIK